MCKLIEVLRSTDIQCNWRTLSIGYSMGMVSKAEVQAFAVEFLENGSFNEVVNELAWGVEEQEFKQLLMKVAMMFDSGKDVLKERRKIRLALLKKAENELSEEDLLKKIATIYSTFDYPKEMENLIYYMPYKMKSKDYGLSGVERILRDFDVFLKNEISEIKAENVTPEK